MGTPRVSCESSRPLSYAKLDQVPSTLPALSASTPSNSSGGLTSCTVSRLLSRKRMVRDSGSSSGSMPAISVLRACIWLSAPSPTTHTGSPAVSSRGARWADFTGVAPMSAGS